MPGSASPPGADPRPPRGPARPGAAPEGPDLPAWLKILWAGASQSSNTPGFWGDRVDQSPPRVLESPALSDGRVRVVRFEAGVSESSYTPANLAFFTSGEVPSRPAPAGLRPAGRGDRDNRKSGPGWGPD